jgi:hypothetical protein
MSQLGDVTDRSHTRDLSSVRGRPRQGDCDRVGDVAGGDGDRLTPTGAARPASYVLKGTLILKTRGQPDRTLKAGDSFFNPLGAVHSFAAALGDDGGHRSPAYEPAH